MCSLSRLHQEGRVFVEALTADNTAYHGHSREDSGPGWVVENSFIHFPQIISLAKRISYDIQEIDIDYEHDR
jgi:hypothetical protein